MTDEHPPIRGEDDDLEPMPTEPRRAASAQFVVHSEAASEAVLRDAMDPANQSLADALRLSYRVLQAVIGILVVLFIFSGWKSVEEGQTGVLTVWGRIVEKGGERALRPGLHFSRWPYPAGEFVLFTEENRPVEVREAFWPNVQGDIEAAVQRASVNDRLKPGLDGSMLTRGVEIAHLQVSGRYAIADAVDFVERLPDDEADRVVQLALQRAAVHRVARMDVESVVDRADALAAEIQRTAQAQLDALDCGIILQAVNLPRTSPPLAIRKTLTELQEARIAVEESLERSRQQANETLTAIAGGRFEELAALITEHEAALDAGDDEAAEATLAAIDVMLQDPATTGEVARIINHAEAYEAQIESTLGNDARRFAALLPTYRDQPNVVVSQLWFETYARVLARDDAEVFWVPSAIASLALAIEGSDKVAQIRRRRSLEQRETEAARSFVTPFGPTRRAGDINTSGRGRQLEVDEETDRLRSKGGRP